MEKSKCTEERKMEVIINKNKVKEMWDCVENGREEHQCHGGVFSWPPRSYTCSFCKREFRSAQALGGHMNVHRRDRARLRQSPPRVDGHGQFSFLNLNLEPNPNLNVNSTTTNPSFSSPFISTSLSSPSRKYPVLDHPPFSSKLPSLFAPPLSSTPPASVSEMRTWSEAKMSHTTPKAPDFGNIRATKRLLELETLGTNEWQGDGSLMKKAEIVRLELEIGLLGQAHEDLDLELRLGCI